MSFFFGVGEDVIVFGLAVKTDMQGGADVCILKCREMVDINLKMRLFKSSSLSRFLAPQKCHISEQ